MEGKNKPNTIACLSIMYCMEQRNFLLRFKLTIELVILNSNRLPQFGIWCLCKYQGSHIIIKSVKIVQLCDISSKSCLSKSLSQQHVAALSLTICPLLSFMGVPDLDPQSSYNQLNSCMDVAQWAAEWCSG